MALLQDMSAGAPIPYLNNNNQGASPGAQKFPVYQQRPNAGGPPSGPPVGPQADPTYYGKK